MKSIEWWPYQKWIPCHHCNSCNVQFYFLEWLEKCIWSRWSVWVRNPTYVYCLWTISGFWKISAEWSVICNLIHHSKHIVCFLYPVWVVSWLPGAAGQTAQWWNTLCTSILQESLGGLKLNGKSIDPRQLKIISKVCKSHYITCKMSLTFAPSHVSPTSQTQRSPHHNG